MSKIEGSEGKNIGEYLLMSEDAVGGNLMLVVSERMVNDGFDILTVYKFLTKNDGTEELFLLSEHAAHTIVSPSRNTMSNLISTR